MTQYIYYQFIFKETLAFTPPFEEEKQGKVWPRDSALF